MAVGTKWLWRQISKFVLGRRRTTRFDDRLRRLERRVVRTEQALSLNLVERRLGGTQDLSRALKQVVTMAHDLTSARSCEIALYTLNTGTYHTALLVGAPTQASAQAMLSEAAGDNPLQAGDQTLVQPVIFAGETLGSLRLSFDRNCEISAEDRDVARLLAVQAGVAILNSRHAEQLGRISREADESLQAKLGFLANLSHEIRAPLGIMINGVELVLRGLCGEVNDDMGEVLGMVKTSGAHLLELVNDVLDFAKVNAGLLEAQYEIVNLSELLTDVQKIIRPLAEKKGQSLIFEITKADQSIEVDRRHIRQVALNILTNAIKYTKDGGEVTVQSEAINGIIVISVRDNGIGMKPEDLELLFDPFKRASNQYAQSQQGTGLGMALSKQLVELNRGTITVRSTWGEGTEVLIGFPQVGEEKKESDAQDHVQEVDGAGRRVLIIDLIDSSADPIARYLESLSFIVSYRRVLRREQLKLLNLGGAGIVILSARNSIDSGSVELIRAHIDEESNRSAVRPVLVVLGSQASRPELEPLLRAGVDRYIVHPSPLSEIARAIDEIHRSGGPTIIDRDPPGPSDLVQ